MSTRSKITRRSTGLATALVLGLASTSASAGGLGPFNASSDAARHWLVLNFDGGPIGQQIAAQGNRALQLIRATVQISAPRLPEPTLDQLASRPGSQEG